MPLPEFIKANQRIKRRAVNPADKSTVVSIYPRPLDEVKHTIFPGRFIIPAANRGDFELLVVGSSSHFREVDPDQPMLEIVNSSADVAKSIVEDFALSCIAASREMMPGLFWVPGSYNKTTILKFQGDIEGPTFGKKWVDLLAEAERKQRAWYLELVKIGDISYAASNGHPSSVDDSMRMACRELSFDRPWMNIVKDITKVACKACGYLVDPAYPICPNCKVVINQQKATELGLKFAV